MAKQSDQCEPGYRKFPVDRYASSYDPRNDPRYESRLGHYPDPLRISHRHFRIDLTRVDVMFLPPSLQTKVIEHFNKKHPGEPELVSLHATEEEIRWFTAAREAHYRQLNTPFEHNRSLRSIPPNMFNDRSTDVAEAFGWMSEESPKAPKLEECIPVKVQKEVKINSSNIEL